MKRFGLILKRGKREALSLAREILNWAASQRTEVHLDPESAKAVGLPERAVPLEEIGRRIDLMLVLGGDGTMLAAARMLAGSNVPILGVNLGGLGFLTTVSANDLTRCLGEALQGKLKIEDRMMLVARVLRRGEEVCKHTVLNDVVIHKGELARMIELELRIDSERVTEMMADGLIFSTPTGSTAYNLSAGGPILYPTERAIVITPICPHTLSNRPLIISADSVVEVEGGEGGEERLLTLDGQQGVRLEMGDRVEVKRAEFPSRFVSSPEKTFYEILRTKLSWAER